MDVYDCMAFAYVRAMHVNALNSCVFLLVCFYWEKDRLKIRVFFFVATIGEGFFVTRKNQKNGDR